MTKRIKTVTKSGIVCGYGSDDDEYVHKTDYIMGTKEKSSDERFLIAKRLRGNEGVSDRSIIEIHKYYDNISRQHNASEFLNLYNDHLKKVNNGKYADFIYINNKIGKQGKSDDRLISGKIIVDLGIIINKSNIESFAIKYLEKELVNSYTDVKLWLVGLTKEFLDNFKDSIDKRYEPTIDNLYKLIE